MLAALMKAPLEYKAVIKNLMQFYIYDFSEFIQLDVDADGLFPAYQHLDEYWTGEDSRFPYIIQKDDKYIGFVLVRLINSGRQDHFSIAEFFVLKRYRRTSIGKFIAGQVFNLHRGRWEVFQKKSNLPAQKFWLKVIDEYTNGQFKQRTETDRIIQEFENTAAIS
jgi:predicted acetyltransferase